MTAFKGHLRVAHFTPPFALAHFALLAAQKPNEYDQCDYASNQANHLITHMFKIKSRIVQDGSQRLFTCQHTLPPFLLAHFVALIVLAHFTVCTASCSKRCN